jgi:translation initiation factor IF-2
MSEVTTAKRLSKVAREFNLGIQTIVDFLKKKGFTVDANPNSKISQDQYELLLKEYSSEITAKKESEKVSLRIAREKAETISIEDVNNETSEEDTDAADSEEELMIKETSSKKTVQPEIKEEAPKVKTPGVEVKVVGKIELEKSKTKLPEKEIPEEKKEEKKPVEETKKTEIEKTPVPEEKIEQEKEEKESKSKLKVVGSIDLDALNQKTRPTKKTKEEKKKEKVKETEKPVEDETKEEIIEEIPKQEEEKPAEKPAKPEVELYKTIFTKLTGPTVVGKIDLPVAKKKEPVASSSDMGGPKKKKRKRIRKDIPGQVPDREKPSTGVSRDSADTSDFHKKKRPLRPEVNEEDVQKQIKDTLARLTSKGKSKGSKHRREKRDILSQRNLEQMEREEEEKSVLQVTEFVTANELATMMNVPVTNIISTCMSLGLFVSINQRLDAETIALLAEEYGFKVKFISVEVQESIKEEEDSPEDLTPRPPIVTVMGHVDHGKTSLLDFIRKTNVIAGEAGGITQHIGAYTVKLDESKVITFLDTPGHEAFTAMRARGAKITDVAIIVVAADDNVMPQTVEAINHAQAAGVPLVFAINKIDKPGANPEKIKEELSKMNILVEDWGGKYQSQEISAKQGKNIELLLEKVLLEAELLDLKANPNKKASGTVIESTLDKGRGYVTTMLVHSGTLNIGDVVLAGTNFGHVKAMFNERGQKVTSAGPSTPVLMLGLNGAPQAGDAFHVMSSDREAKEIATKREQLQREQGLRTQKHITLDEIGRRIAIGNFQELNIIVKGDVDGSIEALSDALIKLSSPEIQINLIHKAVGQISESDILLAAASNAIIIGFQVRPSLSARKLAEKEEIDIRLYSIIYDAIEEIRAAMEGMLIPEMKEEVIATLEVREVFKITKLGTIAGCMVKEGKINRNAKVRLIRDGIVVYTGEIGSLKRFKDDVKEVVTGQDCGLNIVNFNDIKVGDFIEAYKETEVKKKL